MDAPTAAPIPQPAGVNLKVATPDALCRLYISAAASADFGLEYDIKEHEDSSDAVRESYIEKRKNECIAMPAPLVIVLETTTKESRNVTKVTCKRREIISATEQPEHEEEYAFKKTFQGWKLIGIRTKKTQSTQADEPQE